MEHDEGYMTTAQACEYLRVSPKTLQRRRRDGKLVAYLLGYNMIRYRREDLDAIATPSK